METRAYLNIPVAHADGVVTWDQPAIDRLVSSAIGIAVRVGLRLEDDSEGTYLREAESNGATLDRKARAVMFSEADIEETIAIMRSTAPAPHPLRGLSVSEQGREEKFFAGNGANLLFDWDTWQARAPSVVDLIELCRWVQGCDEISGVFPPVMLKDLDPRLSPIYSYALMCKYCRKRVYHEQPTQPLHVRYLERMARVYEQRRGFFQPMQEFEFINPPFRMGRRGIATMRERVDSGACDIMGIGTMCVSGMSAPVTVAGAAVVGLAEILSGLTFFHLLRPDYGLRGSACMGSLDLRTARVGYFGMHAFCVNLAAWDLLVRGLGVDATCLTWYRDANEPGMQAVYEFGMAQAFFSSLLNRCGSEIGGLCNGNLFSPHQAVMDIEVMKEFNELVHGFEISDEALGTGEVIAARFDQGVHMSSVHTLQHMKEGVPFSSFFHRGLPAGAHHEKSRRQTEELMSRADEAVTAAKAKGRDTEPDVDLGNALYEFVKEAASELGIEAPALS